ncbi:MAG: 5-amino-6-(D-ribitylamino)uracil--L-tyrosine 4-hydroxyphenyl transferase CofH [Burkholderiales bacterium]|nr:5-amino-6-(D-ribitylamino)uracil--L-tyrosine 4-hydroxyphenyl transferase CofH [Burkholderiales bacterium]
MLNETAADILQRELPELIAQAHAAALRGHGNRISYSRKVFIPLTRLCRDVCHYCTFAASPRQLDRPYLGADEVLAIARAGARAGCKEALFTLGDKPERRYGSARRALASLGYDSTIAYLEAMCELVLRETGLLPHANPGVMTKDEIARLRRVTVSQGLMLESTAARLCEPGGPHFGSPDKRPERRIETLRHGGELAVPFTTGILIGIGETRAERLEALLTISELHRRYGHIQEVIVQNFRAKAGTRLSAAPEPSLDELAWTIAAARLVLGPEMNIQAPPNLSAPLHARLIAAGINDWGGVSPVTPDHVNPEAPWPHIDALAQASAEQGKVLTERLAIYPRYACEPQRWLDPALRSHVLRATDSEGYARTESWQPGAVHALPAATATVRNPASIARQVADSVAAARTGARLEPDQIVRLFSARGDELEWLCEQADRLRREIVGERVTYVVNRNVNYTNVCSYRCRFCAFAKGTPARGLRGEAYDLALDEVARRAREAWERGASEICMQGGIHPRYTGETYLALVRCVKAAVPQLHVHAFSPLEVWHGAQTLRLSLAQYLQRLIDAGLDSLPGTAAEILDDEVRRAICPDKLTTAQWLEVVETAHALGLPTTATIMFGHVERPLHWARHLLHVRDLQARTRGFTEFVPLPFVAMEAPLYLRGHARSGPSWRETRLMHAIARLVLHPLITNIQTSWVKLGAEGASACLRGGANDLGGTLMNESISRAAGTQHGQELPPAAMEALVAAIGRVPQQRTMRYQPVSAERRRASLAAKPLAALVATPARPARRDLPSLET